MKETTGVPISGFYELGLAPAIQEALARLRYTVPTPIQRQAIPAAALGKDVVGIAQTGTGKTLAFGIPMIQRLLQDRGSRGLIILPTRELALQVDEAIRKIGSSFGLKTAVLIGGASIRPQINDLRRNPTIIVATPGRLLDHVNQRTIRLDTARILVLDEADRMLDMGFAPQINKILHALPRDRQTMLFSATMPAEIMKIAAAHMKLPIRIEIAPAGTTVERVTQEVFIVPHDRKMNLLLKLLELHKGSALVFTRTKHGAKKVVRHIQAAGVRAAEIHSNRSLNQRREALEGFKTGRYRVLVATDIASRGIDVIGIEIVINYDLPGTAEDYVHRIGRTARAGAGGHAITFAMSDQRREITVIERLIKKTLPISRLPDLPPSKFMPEPPRSFLRAPARHYGRPFGSGNRPSPFGGRQRRFPR